MPAYALFNKKLNVHLIHPKIGIWSSSNYEQAQEMLSACQGYVKSLNIADYEQEFIIVDLEETCQMQPEMD